MAQGVYHIFNTAKTRIMEATYQSYPNAISAKEIAERTGMEMGKVSRLLSHYHTRHYGYFRRLKKKDIDGSYRYKINKKGVKAYFDFVLRIKQGFDLNLNRKTPIKMETYMGLRNVKIKSERDLILTPEELAPYVRLSHRGEHELGVKYEDKLKIVGIIKEESIEKSEEPKVQEVPEKPETPIKETKKTVLLPSKMYTLKEGEKPLSSEEMAEVLIYGINKINEQLTSTTDARRIKKLQDKKRKYLMWIIYNPDIKQYTNLK